MSTDYRVKDIEGLLAEFARLHHTIGIQQVELNKVKELNREMVEVLKEITGDSNVLWVGVISDELLQKANWIITKAEGVQ